MWCLFLENGGHENGKKKFTEFNISNIDLSLVFFGAVCTKAPCKAKIGPYWSEQMLPSEGIDS